MEDQKQKANLVFYANVNDRICLITIEGCYMTKEQCEEFADTFQKMSEILEGIK